MSLASALQSNSFDPARVDFDVFALFLEARRLHRRKTVKRVAREAEVHVDAVLRGIRARNPGEVEFFALCSWIGEPPTLFLKSTEGKPDRASCLVARPSAASGPAATSEGHRK